MTARELIKRLLDTPLDSEILIKNLDGTFRAPTLVGVRDEDGTETEIVTDDGAKAQR